MSFEPPFDDKDDFEEWQDQAIQALLDEVPKNTAASIKVINGESDAELVYENGEYTLWSRSPHVDDPHGVQMNELKELPDDKVTVECDITGLEYEVVFKSVSTPVGVREPKKEVIA